MQGSINHVPNEKTRLGFQSVFSEVLVWRDALWNKRITQISLGNSASSSPLWRFPAQTGTSQAVKIHMKETCLTLFNPTLLNHFDHRTFFSQIAY